MGRIKAVLAVEAALASALVLCLIFPSCRREQEPLDRNRAPETYLTSSPTETTATDYLVHMHWHGTDVDGAVERYIWYISDTLLTLDPARYPDAEQRDWNPAHRIADYLRGRFTTKADSTFVFSGFDTERLALINRQAFHIAAIDDGGRIDETPARLQFFARVRGVPTVRFWVNYGLGDEIYDPLALDTISMFAPFTIKFTGATVNNAITGYRWSYGNRIYPDENNDGTPEWLIPATPDEIVSVELPNTRDNPISSGTFNFRATARDEAGALSVSDILTGVGVCRVVVNHDPDTEVLPCDVFYVPSWTSEWQTMTVDFRDGIPDTLPYNSLLRLRYRGWDDPRDELQYVDPRLPIRFQFQFNRWTTDEDGFVIANKLTPWYPITGPEDTNPGADIEDINRDVDSTTMRVGSFRYRVLARSFDEQNRPDGTPPAVTFYGNFAPTITSLRPGFFDPMTTLFRDAIDDTIFIKWTGIPNFSYGDTLGPYKFVVAPGVSLTKFFRWNLLSVGHDDPRDPAGSGIKAWRYYLADADEDILFSNEGQWQYPDPIDTTYIRVNYYNQVVEFSITVPYVGTVEEMNAQTDSLVANPPLLFGAQTFSVGGGDLDSKLFLESWRAISPTFDDDLNKITPGDWIVSEWNVANYARRATRHGSVYLKLVR